MALVILVGGLTALVVAALVGPVFLERHLVEMQSEPGTAIEHATIALRSASTLTLTVAVGASVATSLIASLVLARRIGASLGAMSSAAASVAAGRLHARVVRPGVGSEFDELADAFNEMAARLDEDEVLRRRLMADVAHELRTPVTTMGATLDAVEDGIAELSPQTVATLRAQASRLTRLSADLAAVTRAESGQLHLDRRPVLPAELLHRAADAARERYAAGGVTLRVEPEHGLPPVTVDPDRFGQVLANLLDNAVRHTPAGGCVTLSARGDGPMLLLEVRDTGEGIEAVHLPRLFERFYRADEARDRGRGGSGIGLSISRALIQSHGGTIAAFSDGPGSGARFVIAVPAAGVPQAGNFSKP